MKGVIIISKKNTSEKKVNVSIKIDPFIKEQVEELFSELGMNVSVAVNTFFMQSLREGAIPFAISLNRPNDTTLQAITDVENEQNLSKSYNNTSELMGALNAEN